MRLKSLKVYIILGTSKNQVLEVLKNPQTEEQQALRDRYIKWQVEKEIAALEGMDDLDAFEQEVTLVNFQASVSGKWICGNAISEGLLPVTFTILALCKLSSAATNAFVDIRPLSACRILDREIGVSGFFCSTARIAFSFLSSRSTARLRNRNRDTAAQ